MTLLTVLPRLRTNNLKGLGATPTIDLRSRPFLLRSALASSDRPAHLFALELQGCGDANASGHKTGLSKLVVHDLYQAKRHKIAIPKTLTKICIQIALVVSTRTK